MSRVEECSEVLKALNESSSLITSRCEEPGFTMNPGEFVMSGIEMAKLTVLMDIAMSLAVLADGLSDD